MLIHFSSWTQSTKLCHKVSTAATNIINNVHIWLECMSQAVWWEKSNCKAKPLLLINLLICCRCILHTDDHLGKNNYKRTQITMFILSFFITMNEILLNYQLLMFVLSFQKPQRIENTRFIKLLLIYVCKLHLIPEKTVLIKTNDTFQNAQSFTLPPSISGNSGGFIQLITEAV